jgi:hypothetical protein
MIPLFYKGEPPYIGEPSGKFEMQRDKSGQRSPFRRALAQEFPLYTVLEIMIALNGSAHYRGNIQHRPGGRYYRLAEF